MAPWEKYQSQSAPQAPVADVGPWAKWAAQSIAQEYAPPALAASNARPKPKTFTDRLNDMAGGFVNNLMAGMQQTSPITSTMEGNKPYGDPIATIDDVRETDTGGHVITGPDGKDFPIDSQHQVILRGDDGKMYVYNRSPKTDEGRIASLGRIMSMGFTASPLAVRDAATAVPGAMTKNVAMFDRQNIPPTLASATNSRPIGFVHNTLKDFFPSAGVVEGRDIAQLRAASARADELAGSYGKGTTPLDAGTALKTGAQQFVERASTGMSDRDIMLSPTRMSSFAEKSDVAYGRVDKLVPSQTSVDMAGTIKAFDDVSSKFDLAELGKKFQDPTLSTIGDVLKKNGAVLTWNDAKNLRTEIGKLLRKPAIVSDIDRSQLESVYGALSDDMGRAASAAGPEAAKAWRNANAYYAAGMNRINTTVSKVLTPGSADEAPFSLLMKATQSGKATENANRLIQLRRSVSDEQWGDVASTVIKEMGKPLAGVADPAGKLPPFSASSFVTRYESLSDTAKDMLFDGAGRSNLRSALDEFVTVLGRIKNAERLQNSSRTASGVSIFGTAAALAASPTKAILGLLGANLTARGMTNPGFVRWLARAAETKTSGELASQVARLSQLARLDKSLSDVADTLRQGLQLSPAGPDSQNDGQRQ